MRFALRHAVYKNGRTVLDEIREFDAFCRPFHEDQCSQSYLEHWFQGKVNDWNRIGAIQSSTPDPATGDAKQTYYYELVQVSDTMVLPLKFTS